MESAALDEMIDAYDEHFVLDNTLMLKWYPRRVVQMAGKGSLLELGLGHGLSTAFFAQHFSPYRVIEGSPEMIRRFQSRFAPGHVDIVQSYFESYETGDRFDNIAMGFILEHVEDAGLILGRFRRFLRAAGSVFIAVPNSESLHRRFGHAAGLLPDMEALSQADLDFGHRRYFNLRTLTKLVEEQGYEVVKVEGLFLKPITTGQIEQLSLSPSVLEAMMAVGVDYPELSNAILLQARPLM
jgi:SAM-dependent methyltransferase